MPGRKIIILITLTIFFISCGETPVPRPRGFFRIDLPESSLITFDNAYPYSFKYPDYAVPVVKNNNPVQSYWLNMQFPPFNGTLHISYKPVNSNLGNLIEDAHSMVMKHIPKSSGIEETLLLFPAHNVYGTAYHINGSEAASPYQFYITDSTRHFIRGALYFNTLPNNDSLAPVISFLKKDIEKIISTLQWK